MKSTTRQRNFALSVLRFYPRSWRKRYQDEVAAVLEECPVNVRTIISLMFGLCDAYLHTYLFTENEFQVEKYLRNRQVTIFSAFLLLIIPLLGNLLFEGSEFWWKFWIFQDDSFFSDRLVLHLYPRITLIHGSLVQDVMNCCGIAALVTTALGMIWLVTIAAWQSCVQKRRSFFLLLLSWIVSIVLIPLIWWYKLNHFERVFWGFSSVSKNIFGMLLLSLIFWVVVVAPFCLLLNSRSIAIPRRFLRISALLSFVTTMNMVGMFITKIYLVLAVYFLAPGFLASTGKLGIAWLGLLTIICAIALRQSFQMSRAHATRGLRSS